MANKNTARKPRASGTRLFTSLGTCLLRWWGSIFFLGHHHHHHPVPQLARLSAAGTVAAKTSWRSVKTRTPVKTRQNLCNGSSAADNALMQFMVIMLFSTF
jgi:hypothetical protein